ncbi:hypothetical protein SH1V18_38910 [Vallitalea longa]|uniref:Uncharacterized protein n=1 Tax=Vallitalea longa TaxID=2936439 RepID=A0A9W6DFM9_9FIRM|nr:hypothetical protein [Vallitalea longa]GKX31411.1 hypothetical protein SH1V18_38910 [Vallitalea longa]
MKKKILGLFLISLIILGTLTGLISIASDDLKTSKGKYEINNEKPLYINNNNCNCKLVEWNKDYVEIYSTFLFNSLYKDKPYDISYENNQLEFKKTPINQIIIFNVPDMYIIRNLQKDNSSDILYNESDFTIYYPQGTKIQNLD